MSAKASVRLKFQTRKQLECVFRALEPETHASLTRRSKVTMNKEGNSLNLTFEATDTSALRAAINSYLHWILLTRDVLDSVQTTQTSGRSTQGFQ
jgi:tRNA threonylcarbamoyladenosine modification (KEOPS) complex  Pcc1 subunit